MVHKFNVGDRVVFIGEPSRYKELLKTIAGMHGEILNVEASIPGYDLPIYDVKFDGTLSKVYVYESLLSFEWECEYGSVNAAIDQGSINLFLGI